MNDVLLAVWEHIEGNNSDKSSLKNWIAGIARYKAIDCKRKYLRYLKEELSHYKPINLAEEIMIDYCYRQVYIINIDKCRL